MSRPVLPSSPAELRGLRARRYVRVSSEEQGRKYGQDGQHETIDFAVRQLGLVEAGEPFVDEQSAWSRSDTRPALRELVAAAGQYDVLVVAYFSRWSRDTELSLRLRRELHAAGVVIWFADEAFASSDDGAHERYLDEAVASEKFSHRLSRTIRKTFAAKFDRYGDQAGSPGLGFTRTPQPEARLVVDPGTMPRAVALFERYAQGDLSYRELATLFGMAEGAVRGILVNPLYNGWAVRGRRSAAEKRVPAPWRSAPPVSDDLWARVAAVREARAKNAGRQRARRTYLLAKRLWCACGKVIPADTGQGRDGTVIWRYRHEDCALGGQVTWKAEHYEAPIAKQLASLRLDAGVLARIRATIDAPAPATTDLRRGQLERELRARASAHAARRLTTEAYLAEHARITAELDAMRAPGPAAEDDADAIIAALRDVKAAWKDADEDARAGLVRAIYQRVTVHAGEFVGVELTPWAEQLRMAIALPDEVALARPARAGLAQSTTVRIRIPIAGREAWLRASRRSA